MWLIEERWALTFRSDRAYSVLPAGVKLGEKCPTDLTLAQTNATPAIEDTCISVSSGACVLLRIYTLF